MESMSWAVDYTAMVNGLLWVVNQFCNGGPLDIVPIPCNCSYLLLKRSNNQNHWYLHLISTRWRSYVTW